MYLDKQVPIRIMMDDDSGDAGGGEGNDNDTWIDSLPESIRDWDEVKNSDSPDKFWDQVTNMRAFLGQSIRIPGENASAEDHKAFNEKLISKVPGLLPAPNYENEDSLNAYYRAVGRPEKAEEYKPPEIDAKGVELDDTPVKAFMPIAHKHGLSQKQFEGIVADMTNTNRDLALAAATAMEEGKTQLKNEWGMAFDKNMKRITNVVSNTGAPPALVEAVKSGNVDPSTGKWLLGIADSFKGEGSNLIDDEGASKGLLTPENARKEITDILNNKEHAYWKPLMAGHAEAKKHMRALYKMAHPTPGTGQVGTAGAGGEIEIRG